MKPNHTTTRRSLNDPVDRANESHQATESSAPTILVVDDEMMGRETLAALLYPQGYHLIFAANGAEAIDQAVTSNPDLILLDIMMPEMDGLEVCKRLRSRDITREIPIILVTALDGRDARINGIEAGADDFITKPFDRIELRARIRTILRLNRYRHLLIERTNLAHLIEYAPDGILIINQDGMIVLANPAALRLFQARHDSDLLGVQFPALLTADKRTSCETKLQHILAASSDAMQLETTIMTLNGARLPIEMHMAHFIWHERPAAQIMVRDISERRRAELLEEERQQIAYDLHDGLAQIVTSTHQHLQAFAARHRPHAPQTRTELDHVLKLAQSSVREVRRVIAGLRPTALEDFGLAAALQIHVAALKADGWDIRYHETLGAERLAGAVEIAFFRIAQESLTNIRKHAHTTRVEVTLEWESTVLRLTVRDWGQGFEPELLDSASEPGKHIGLRGMRERIGLLGGQLLLESHTGQGTTVIAEAPIEASILRE